MCRPALAIELRLDSGLDCRRSAMDSGWLEMADVDGAASEFEIAADSLFDCIKAAMDGGRSTPGR